MLISDAMRRSNTACEIEYLLTAYMETLQFYGAAQQLPPGVASLPLRGASDINSRYKALLGLDACGMSHAHRDMQGAIAREAREIFGAACVRLQALQMLPPLQTRKPIADYAGSR